MKIVRDFSFEGILGLPLEEVEKQVKELGFETRSVHNLQWNGYNAEIPSNVLVLRYYTVQWPCGTFVDVVIGFKHD